MGTTTRRGLLVGAGVAGAVATGVGVAAWDRGLEPSSYAVPRDERPRRGRRRPPRTDRPNVVVVSVDDLGWNELGCYGHPFNRTPEIDRLAEEGLRFTRAYAAAPLCSPTRAAMMTGRYPARCGITDFLRPEPASSDASLDPAHSTVPDVLRPRGYTTGLVGKWHLTETYSGRYRTRPGNPWAHGFDDVRVSEQLYIAGGDYTHPYFFMPTLPALDESSSTPEHLTDRLAAEAVDFIRVHADEPFFLHVSNYAVHVDHEAPADLVAAYEALPGAGTAPNRPVVAAMLDRVDAQVGRIRRALERHGLDRRTLLLVTSDNGSERREVNAPLRGAKSELYEGGIRVPLVAWGPGLVEPGRTTDQIASTIDLLPTAADLAGARERRGRLDRTGWDGVSLVPTLTGRGRQRTREATFWVYPHLAAPRTRPQAAVVVGDDKLVMSLRDRRVELFDLATDEEETTDLAGSRPDVVRRLTALLEDHLAEMDLYPGAPSGRGARDGAGVVELDGSLVTLAGELALAGDGPSSEQWEMVLDPGDLGGDDRVLLGLAAGPEDHLLLAYDHARRGIVWDLRVAGRPVTAGMEPLGLLDGTVGLDRRTARLGLVGRGATVAAYVDETGDGWELLCRLDVTGALDLARPAVRRRLRWAAGGPVDTLTARDR